MQCEGPKNRQRFLCELRLSSFDYVGIGNSTNKKDSERNAARDFISFMVRTGVLHANQVPAEGPPAGSSGGGGGGNRDDNQMQYSNAPHKQRNVFHVSA